RDAEDAAEGNVDDVEVAVFVERRPLDEAVGRKSRPVGIGPVAPLPAAESVGHRGEERGLDQARGRFQGTIPGASIGAETWLRAPNPNSSLVPDAPARGLKMGPGSAAYHFVMRCVRGTRAAGQSE
ncbi:hypothetical protein E4T56_gene17174, partial [Termitomyces sp. T112]